MLNGHLDGLIWVWFSSICVPDVGDGTERALNTSAGEIRWAGPQDIGVWDQVLNKMERLTKNGLVFYRKRSEASELTQTQVRNITLLRKEHREAPSCPSTHTRAVQSISAGGRCTQHPQAVSGLQP